MYVLIEAKEQRTDVNNIGNTPVEYTLDDSCLGKGKIWPQEDPIRILEGPTQIMAGRSAQTVNDMPADICMYQGKGAEHRRQQRR